MPQHTQHLDTLQRIYGAFGRGDVPTILEEMAPDVHWEFATPDHGVPWLREGRGREAVAAFFGTIANELEIETFEVISIMTEGPWAVALVRLVATVKRTGKRLREDCEAHIWRFDDSGKVVAVRHAADTATHVAALRS